MDAPPLQEQQRIMMAYNNMMHSGPCGGCARKMAENGPGPEEWLPET